MQQTKRRFHFPVHIVVFLAPAVLLYTVFMVIPLINSLRLSFFELGNQNQHSFVGLQNFRDVLVNEIFQRTVYNSFVFTGIAVVLKAVLGIWLAMLLFRNLKGKRFIRGAVLLPWVIPTALSTLAWWWMFDSLYSVVNWTAIRLGLVSPPGPN